jgi:hypothetical protein
MCSIKALISVLFCPTGRKLIKRAPDIESFVMAPSPLAGAYIHPMSMSMTNSMLSKPTLTIDTKGQVPDHYAVLELDDPWARSGEIQDAFCRLRADAFKHDVAKYRALQAAYEVLINMDSRYAYDVIYRPARGLPAPWKPVRPVGPVVAEVQTRSESASTSSNPTGRLASTNASSARSVTSSVPNTTPPNQTSEAKRPRRTGQMSLLPLPRTHGASVQRLTDAAQSAPNSRLPISRTHNTDKKQSLPVSSLPKRL